jgi:hypothetical protein
MTVQGFRLLPSSLAATLLLLLQVGCSGSSSSPTAPSSCEFNSTAEVTFRNTSSSQTMQVNINQGVGAVLAPGESKTVTLAAGTWAVQFINTATGKRACSDSSWTWAACTSSSLSCAGSSSGGGGGGGTGSGTGNPGTSSQCGSAGLGACTYGAGTYCAPFGTVCCGYRQYCPSIAGIVYATAYNCQHGAPDLPWACYDRDAINTYIQQAACLNAKSYACDQLPK